MKKIFLSILLIVCYSISVNAQTIDLDKLPQQKRDSILIDIAKSTILKYTEGYDRGDIPTIKDLGIFKTESKKEELKKYNGIKIYSVSYPFTAEEKAYYTKKDALVSVTITADIGKPIEMEFGDGTGIRIWIADGKNSFKRKYRSLDEAKQTGWHFIGTTQTVFTEEELLRLLPPEALKRKRESDSIGRILMKRKNESIQRRRMEDSLRNVKHL